jgi:hypothetical protein
MQGNPRPTYARREWGLSRTHGEKEKKETVKLDRKVEKTKKLKDRKDKRTTEKAWKIAEKKWSRKSVKDP